MRFLAKVQIGHLDPGWKELNAYILRMAIIPDADCRTPGQIRAELRTPSVDAETLFYCPLCDFSDTMIEVTYTHLCQEHMEFRGSQYHCPCGWRNVWLSGWINHVSDFADFAQHYHDAVNGVLTEKE